MVIKHEGLMSEERRQFIKGSAALAAGSAVPSGVWAAGSDAPEKKEVRIGFIPLTDCASVVMASVLKFDEKYGTNWHCVVGKNFSSFVSYEAKNYIFFYEGQLAVLLYKIG